MLARMLCFVWSPSLITICSLFSDVVLMVSMFHDAIILFSISTRSRISFSQVGHKRDLRSICVMNKEKVCVGGEEGYCAIVAIPPDFRILLDTHINRKFACPVQNALLDTRDGFFVASKSLQSVFILE